MPEEDLVKLISLFSIALVFTACSSDREKLGDAQACMDSADATNVDECLTKIDGITTSQSYLIRCGAIYIKEGFDSAEKISSAFQNLEQGNSVVDFFSVLAFDGEDAETNMNLAIEYCNQSGSSGFVFLTSMVTVATTLSLSITGFDPDDPNAAEQIQAKIDNGEDISQAEEVAIGAAARNASGSYCSEDDADDQLCSDFNNAIASGASDEEIGELLISTWQSN